MKKKKILSYRIARELIKQGFRVIDIQPNNSNPDRTIFIFENNIALTTYLNQHRKEAVNEGTYKDNKGNDSRVCSE